MPARLRGSVVNCDCFNTEAPNIGNAAVRQCIHAEQGLMQLAGQGELVYDVEDDKLKAGEFCDFVTAGPAPGRSKARARHRRTRAGPTAVPRSTSI